MNIDHNYTLMTSIWGSTNATGHHQYEMETNFNDSVCVPASVPEPTTMLLFGTGLAGLAGSRIRRKKKA